MTETPQPGPRPVTAAPEGEQVMDLLAEHVPLALLVDLITPECPASADILRAEGRPDDAWWEPDDHVAPGHAAATGEGPEVPAPPAP